MNILAIDTSHTYCLVGLLNNDQQDYIAEPTSRGHAAMVLPLIERLLQKNKMKLADLSALAYVAGPASFTGVRIAASVVQALALSQNKPVCLIPSLQYIAQGYYEQLENQTVIVAMDAYMQEIYWGEFYANDQLMQPIVLHQLLQPGQVKLPAGCLYGIGNVWEKYTEIPRPNKILPPEYSSQALLALARHYVGAGNLVDADKALPVYLRDENAWTKQHN